MRTFIASSLLCLVTLAFCPPAKAHGVERGSIHESLLGTELAGDLSQHVQNTLISRCNLVGTKAVSAINETLEEQVDQDVVDRFHLLRIVVEKDGMEEVILLRLAEYAFSNPSVPNKEIVSLESSLCR